MNFDTLFPDNRESGETRLKQCQLVMLRMLKILDYLCKKHDIEYFLMGGSLLGAVRHQGFIPWDDDLDVGMTRNNYDRFLKFAVQELPHEIFFQHQGTDPNYTPSHIVEAKLRDKYSNMHHPTNKGKYHDGIMLDIFVWDRAYLPHNFFIYLLNRSLIFICGKGGHRRRQKIMKFIDKWIPLPLVYSNNYISYTSLLKMGTHYMKKSEIFSFGRMKFEDMEAPVPKDYHACLKRQYGNYMQLPPLEQQKGHHSVSLPDPFTPCEHKEILLWNSRKTEGAPTAVD